MQMMAERAFAQCVPALIYRNIKQNHYKQANYNKNKTAIDAEARSALERELVAF